MRILIVDDDTVIAGLLADILEGAGHAVCGIETTEAGAVAAALRHRPGLVIIDLTLGSGSGVRAMEQIDRHGPVPRVFISGRKGATGTEVLLKPFREADLLQAVTRALAGAEHGLASR